MEALTASEKVTVGTVDVTTPAAPLTGLNAVTVGSVVSTAPGVVNKMVYVVLRALPAISVI